MILERGNNFRMKRLLKFFSMLLFMLLAAGLGLYVALQYGLLILEVYAFLIFMAIITPWFLTDLLVTWTELFSIIIGSFILFFAAMAMTKNYFGAEVVKYAATRGVDATQIQGKVAIGSHINAGLAVAHLALGFLVMALVTSLGGPTGPGLNPARDLGPRILHFLLPKSVLGEHKGDSKWWYAWVPVVSPILAGIAAVALYKMIYG